jgi:hypothetical protein
MRFLRNRYSYEFIDDEQRKKYGGKIPFRYLEKLVAAGGRGAIYRDDSVGFNVYKPVIANRYDIYGRPIAYTLYTSNGSDILYNIQADDKNLIILQDHFDGSSLSYVVNYYAEQLGKVRETLLTNISAMRVPFLIQAPKEKKFEVERILKAMQEEPEVLVDPNLEFSEVVKIVELKVPDRLKTLEDEYNTIFGKFKEEIGFSSQNIDKKERLVAAEAENDDDTLKAFDNEPYEMRKLFIKEMDDKFGIQLRLIKANDDLYVSDTKEVKES